MGTTKMNSKICLILFGLLVALAVLASAENNEESSLSEELGSSRVARSADADAARRKRKTLRKRKRTQKKGLKKRNKNKSKRRKNTKRTKKTNMTFVDACVNATDLFKTLATECMTMSKEATATEACACWSAPEMTMASEAVKDCKITEVSAIAQGLKACKDAFSTCRKFEDEAVSSMAACSVSTDALKAKAAALSQSKTAMDAAASTVATITGSSRKVRGLARGKRAAAADAAAFITLVTTIVTIAIDFPSQFLLLTVSADIVASSSLTFTDDEITSLTAVEETLTAAVELVTDAFAEAQATLEDATGSTLSAAGLSSVAASITTARARQRVRGFQSQRNMFQ